MRSTSFVAATLAILVVLLAALVNFTEPPSAKGIILPMPPPALGVLLVVDTTSDANVADGYCSLREAIIATNINGVANECDARASHSGATDGIVFNLGTGTPTINISSQLPAITDKVAIDGNSGGASRVELHGPGILSGVSGLSISGSGASGSSARSLVINNFSNGIDVETTGGVTILGSYIGTNSSGTVASPNSTGIYVYNSNATIGASAG